MRISLPHSRQEAEKEREGEGQDTTKDPTPVTYFLQLGPPPKVSEPPTNCGLSVQCMSLRGCFTLEL